MVQAHGIYLDSAPQGLPCGADAMIVQLINGFTAILLDEDLLETEAQLIVALVHELAHYLEGALYTVGAPPALIYKAECKAERRQIQMLLPFEELQEAVRSGYDTVYALADHFGLTEEFVHDAVDYYLGYCGKHF